MSSRFSVEWLRSGQRGLRRIVSIPRKMLCDFLGCSIESEIRRYSGGTRLRLQGRSFRYRMP